MLSIHRCRWLPVLAACFFANLSFALLPLTSHAATIPVNTTAPGVVADSACGLVEAIQAANMNTASNGCPAGDPLLLDTIVLGVGATYTVTGSHVVDDELGPIGLPSITSNIAISGNSASIERSSSEKFRLFNVAANSGDLTLVDVTVRNGYAFTDDLSTILAYGGAIHNRGKLTLVNSSIISNTAINDGGGIYNSGTAVFIDSHIDSNTTGADGDIFGLGGGILNVGMMILTGTLVTNNSPNGIGNVATAIITSTTIANNLGVGIQNTVGTLRLTNSAVASNGGTGVGNASRATAFFTGTHITDNLVGIYNFDESSLEIINSSIDNNSGSGILNAARSSITLVNSSVDSNSGGISNENGSKVLAIDSSISSNMGGGIYNAGGAITLTNSIIAFNVSHSWGGGIANGSGSVTLVNSRVLSNSSELDETGGPGEGGGIFNTGSMEITGSELSGNHAVNRGGAIYNGLRASLRITESRILNNSSAFGGGAIYQTDGSSSIDHSCIAGNSSPAIHYFGGTEIDATDNWWGSPDGPSGAGIGLGDSVSAWVDFHPYLEVTPLGCPGRAAVGKIYLAGVENMTPVNLIVVDSSVAFDVDTADNNCTLPEAILAANSDSPQDQCPAGRGARDIIVLAANETYRLPGSYGDDSLSGATGLPVITSKMTIRGNGATIERSGDELFRLLHVGGVTGHLTLHDITLRNGRTENVGGAILNDNVLTVVNSHLVSNMAVSGGAIATGFGATTNLVNSSLADNTATTGHGGALANGRMAMVTFTGSQILSNHAESGGALYNDRGYIEIRASSILSNSALHNGGAIRNMGTVIIDGALIAANTAGSRGGVMLQTEGFYFFATRFQITHSRLLDNTAGQLGGAISRDYGPGTIDQSCIVGNSDVALYSAPNGEIDAKNNWWGATDGPGSTGSGAGDSVSAQVVYEPYLEGAILECPTLP